jgi:DNA-binding NarL/FixJ family response regulator
VRVLIADDHSFFADALSTILRVREDVDIVGRARNGREAVDMAASLSPDVILIDLDMPVMDGLEAIRLIREHSQVAMLLLSGSDSPQEIASALAAGASGFLRKDTDPGELATRVYELGAQA